MEKAISSVLVQGVTVEDLERIIGKAIDKRMTAFYESIKVKPPVMVRRKDAAKMLGVSLPTIDAYAKVGILHAKHLGGRVYFSEEEIIKFSKR